MNRNRPFDSPKSEKYTGAYQTYDGRSVSRDEIQRALFRADGATRLFGGRFLIILGVLFVVTTVMALWLMYH